MIQAFGAYIKGIAMFIVFMSFVRIISPGNKYKELLELVLGFILILIVIEPVTGLFSSSGLFIKEAEALFNNEVYLKSAEITPDAVQNEMILAKYKETLTEQIKTLTERLSAETNLNFNGCEFQIDESEEDFGSILQLTVYVYKSESEPKKNRLLRIEKVLPKDDKAEAYDDEAEKLKIKISDFYNLPTSNIYIVVR